MKKSLILVVLTLASVVLMGCASFPEPSDKNSNLVYGTLEFELTNQTNANLVPEYDNKKSNIELEIRNRKTRKIYKFRSNSKGEIFRTGLPAGPYEIISMHKEITYGQNVFNFGFDIEKDRSKGRYEFIVNDQVVTNLGHVKFEIKFQNASSYMNYWTWRYMYTEAYGSFLNNHDDSKWLRAEWINADESKIEW